MIYQVGVAFPSYSLCIFDEVSIQTAVYSPPFCGYPQLTLEDPLSLIQIEEEYTARKLCLHLTMNPEMNKAWYDEEL
mgnify:CR=1 FL=1